MENKNQYNQELEQKTVICPRCKHRVLKDRIVKLNPKTFLCIDCYKKQQEQVKKVVKKIASFKKKTEMISPQERTKIQEEEARLERKHRRITEWDFL